MICRLFLGEAAAVVATRTDVVLSFLLLRNVVIILLTDPCESYRFVPVRLGGGSSFE